MTGPGPGPARGWPLQRSFAVVIAVAGLVVLLAVVGGTVALVRLSDARSDLVDEAGPAVVAGQQLAATLLDQETGVRGYGLTGRAEFLQPYELGRAAEPVAVSRVRALVGEGTPAAADLDRVEAAAGRWRTEFAEPAVAAARAGSAAPSPDLGLALFDQIRAALDQQDRSLSAALEGARGRLADAAGLVGWAGVAIAAVLVMVLVGASLALRSAVLRPVSRLADRVRAVAGGDVESRVAGTGPREIVGLGADVDAMRRAIVEQLDLARETNRQLDERTRDLERSNRDLEQFAYVASHDLQEPLRKVSSFCQLLARRYRGKLDERADQYLDFAVDGAQRMQQLIDDLLTFSQVGRPDTAVTPVDLDAVLETVRGQLEPLRQQAGGEIVGGGLPTVSGDRALLTALLVNLVGNGLKFARPGVPPRVTVTAGTGPDGVELTVADNGIGIEPEYADKIFVIFQRLHGRDAYPGTGIGLAMAKKIVEFHGGHIALGPASGEGATMRVVLPTGECEERP